MPVKIQAQIPVQTTLFRPDKAGQQVTDRLAIQAFLEERDITFAHWPVKAVEDALTEALWTEDALLQAYGPELRPWMAQKGYQTADVVHVSAQTSNIEALQAKFLQEHTHTEDEVRFFVAGHGDFWFHFKHARFPEAEVFCIRCTAGDLLAVPAGVAHWFDMGPEPRVSVIRIFTDPGGWTPHYTGSGLEKRYTRSIN